MVTHGHGGHRALTGEVPPALPRVPPMSLDQILHDLPVARLASIGGYKGWQIRVEERFPDGQMGDARAWRMIVRGQGFELETNWGRFANRVFGEAVLAHQMLQKIADAGLGVPVPGSLFAEQEISPRFLALVRRLNLPKPRVELVMGNMEQLRTFTAECYAQLPQGRAHDTGSGPSVREACQAASQRVLSLAEVRSQLSLRESSDASSTLVSALLRANCAKPQFLVHHTVDPIGVACVLDIPGREPRRFLGHADTYVHAREVAASRAFHWLDHALRRAQHHARPRPAGGNEY